MCEFCKRFDFGNAKIEVDKYGARVCLALGSYRYPKHERFKFCPECGEQLFNPHKGLKDRICAACNKQFPNEPCEPSECLILAVTESEE